VITFTVPGIPAPKGSRTPGRRKDGSIFTRPASRSEHGWVEAVAAVARAYGHRARLAPPYRIDLRFALPRPKRPSYDYPTRGDVDKLARAVLDGLTQGGVITDDRHVTDLVATKRFASPGQEGVTVTVSGSEGGA